MIIVTLISCLIIGILSCFGVKIDFKKVFDVLVKG